MTELDPRIQASIDRSRSGDYGPPAGVEERMLAQFHARLGGPPDGDPGGSEAGPGPKITAGDQLLHAIKIAAAVVGLTAAGLGGVAVAGKTLRAARSPGDTIVETNADPKLEPPTSDPSTKLEAATTPPDPSGEPPTQADTSEASTSAPASPSSPARPRSPSSAPAGAATTLAAELQLIRAARNAPPSQALELLDRHAEQFAEGELCDEREGLRIIALCDLERFDAAGLASKRFVAGSPGALLMQRVASACGDQISWPTTDSKPAGNRSN